MVFGGGVFKGWLKFDIEGQNTAGKRIHTQKCMYGKMFTYSKSYDIIYDYLSLWYVIKTLYY